MRPGVPATSVVRVTSTPWTGHNLHHGQNRLTENPGACLTDCSGGHGNDVRNQELATRERHVNRFKHLSIGTRGEDRLGQSMVQPVGRPLMATPGAGLTTRTPPS